MISNRLKSLSKYVDASDKIIDIGCDHALLDIYLIQNKIVDKIIVSDISKLALNQGIKNIYKLNLQDKIFPRLEDGLKAINDNDDVNTLIISGMGANNILKILNDKKINFIDKLILQSTRDYDILRKNITSMGFYIATEEVLKERNKIYINIIFKRGFKQINDIEIKYGSKNMLNKNIYYEYLIKKLKKIYQNNKDKKIQNEIKLIESLKEDF